MRHLITALVVLSFALRPDNVLAQCSVEAFPSDTVTITCGQELELQLSAFGISGDFAINNDFNDQSVGPGWDGTPAVTFTNPCVESPDSSTYIWMGDATPQPRILTTQAFDLSTGGTICFEMRFAVQGEAAPCEGPDEPDEGVDLQYSIDNGATWVSINYFDPIGGFDPTLTSWQQYCFGIPPAAQTPNTRIRWFQDATSGAEYDHWGLDNVFISINDPSYSYTWDHNGFSGPEPPPVFVSTDSVFTVSYGNGVDDNCSDTVVVQTVPPEFAVTTTPDTSICGDGCIDLNGTADILVRPFSQPTFLNNEFQPLAPLGQPTVIPVATGGVEVETVDSTTIESICLNVNNPAFPFPVNLATFTITLECPEGASVTLLEAGDATGTTLANTCFSNNGTPLSSGTPPYSGTFVPASGSFDDLIGCSTNGVWTVTVTNSDALAFGFFNSWDITFNVPEIRYQGVYSWNPTTGLDDPTSLNPSACPEESTTYELMVTDSFNCATSVKEVTIGIIEPGQLGVEASIQDANCGSEDGTIAVQVTGASGNETVIWEDGSNDTLRTGLASGVYEVRVEDGCALDTTLSVGSLGGPAIDTVETVAPEPEEINGELTVLATGGTAPLEYSIDGGDFQAANTFNGLAAGTYLVTVQDAFGCQNSLTVTLDEFIEIKIPSIFNPNSDETDNRTFVIQGMEAPEVTIFDRWGRKVFESTAYQNEWQGDPAADGVFYYIIKDKADGEVYTGYVHMKS